MPDISIHNETGYDLSPLMLNQIISESVEHFGERIAAIRVQLNIDRHAFNTKTCEVRFAFSPFDYGFSEATEPPAQGAAPNHDMASLHDDSDDLILTDYIDDEDETDFDMLDDILEVPESSDEPVFQEFDADYYAIESGDPDSFSADGTEFDHYQS